MTEKQATLFVRAGYFPKENDIEAICDLQDVFGHQIYWFIIKLLCEEDDEYRENAERLFNLIWNKDDVAGAYIQVAHEIRAKIHERDRLYKEYSKIQEEVENIESKFYYGSEQQRTCKSSPAL